MREPSDVRYEAFRACSESLRRPVREPPWNTMNDDVTHHPAHPAPEAEPAAAPAVEPAACLGPVDAPAFEAA